MSEELKQEFRHLIYKGKVDLNMDYGELSSLFEQAMLEFSEEEDVE